MCVDDAGCLEKASFQFVSSRVATETDRGGLNGAGEWGTLERESQLFQRMDPFLQLAPYPRIPKGAMPFMDMLQELEQHVDRAWVKGCR